MSLDLPSSEVVCYLARFKLAAVYVAAIRGSDVPCLLGSACDLL
jgi:hypothetical protein